MSELIKNYRKLQKKEKERNKIVREIRKAEDSKSLGLSLISLIVSTLLFLLSMTHLKGSDNVVDYYFIFYQILSLGSIGLFSFLFLKNANIHKEIDSFQLTGTIMGIVAFSLTVFLIGTLIFCDFESGSKYFIGITIFSIGFHLPLLMLKVLFASGMPSNPFNIKKLIENCNLYTEIKKEIKVLESKKFELEKEKDSIYKAIELISEDKLSSTEKNYVEDIVENLSKQEKEKKKNQKLALKLKKDVAVHFNEENQVELTIENN